MPRSIDATAVRVSRLQPGCFWWRGLSSLRILVVELQKLSANGSRVIRAIHRHSCGPVSFAVADGSGRGGG